MKNSIMNKNYTKIRHIKDSNSLLEKRLMNEQSQTHRNILTEGVCVAGDNDIEELKNASLQAAQRKDVDFPATLSINGNCVYLDAKIGNTTYSVLL